MTRDEFKIFLSNLLILTILFGLFFAVGASYSLFLFAIPFMFLGFVRIRIKNTTLAVILHGVILTGGIAFAFGDIVAVVFVSVITLYSLLSMYKGELDLHSLNELWLFIIFITLFILSSHGLLVFLYLVALILNLTYQYMKNIDFSITMIKAVNKYDYPMGKVFSTNNTFILILTIGTGAIGLIFAFLPAERMFTNMAAVLLPPFRWIFLQLIHAVIWILSFVPVAELPYVGETEFEEPVGLLIYETFVERNGANNIGILYTIVGLVIVVVLWFIVKSLGSKIIKAQRREQEDSSEIISLDRRVISDLLNLLPSFKGRIPQHPVRRAYTKKVNKYIRSGLSIQNYDTTTHIAQKIGEKEDIDELTAIYEKARYGIANNNEKRER
ncbi:MAG: hypothetical protein FWE02_00580 [Defluviitaleaceae bacterium]|nr:hypothetical protein [Defluviitaleaceae bacterium]